MSMGRYYEQKGREDDIKELMAISGGGENQLYLCKIYSYEDEYDEVWLYEPGKSWREEVEITDVFTGFYPPALCFEIDLILLAVETYANFGYRDKLLHWGYFPLNQSPELEIIKI